MKRIISLLLALVLTLQMLPVAARAEETTAPEEGTQETVCTHKQTEIAWDTKQAISYTKISDTQHQISGYQYRYCTNCFARVGESFAAEELEDHSLDSNGKCSLCGHGSGSDCSHTNTETAWDTEHSMTYNKVSDTQHNVVGYQYTYCTNCFLRIGDSVFSWESEDHSIASNGKCSLCGYDSTCPHEKITVVTEPLTVGYKKVSDTQHVELVHEYDYCLKCQIRVGENRVVESTRYSNHTLDARGMCKYCEPCAHETKITDWDPDQLTRPSYYQHDAFQHMTKGYQHTYCASCHEQFGTDFWAEVLEDHNLNESGKCTLCGYQSDTSIECTHEYDTYVWDTDYPYDYIYVNESKHKAVGYQYRCCLNCSERLGESSLVLLSQSHHPDNSGVCIECGNNTNCRHSYTTVYWDTEQTLTYTQYNDTQHKTSGYKHNLCKLCGEQVGNSFAAEEYEDHVMPNNTRYCPFCKYYKRNEGTGGTCGDNLTWKLDEEGTLTISGTGAMSDANQTNVFAPWKNSRHKITRLVIEEGVTATGNFMFDDCAKLTEVVLPNSLATIANRSFNKCSGLTEIIIPTSVTTIEGWAFGNCTSLKDIEISDSITNINAGVFYGCSSLQSITIPSSVTNIGDNAFQNCSSLSSITIPGSVTSIGKSAFAGCSSLASVTISVSVTRIDMYAFSNCTSLKDVYYEGTQEEWDTLKQNIGINNECLLNAKLHVKEPEDLPDLPSDNTCGENLTYALSSNGILTISGTGAMTDYQPGEAPWYENKLNILSVVVESGVTSIGSQAFPDCKNLSKISLATTVKSIGSGSFKDCTKLVAISLPDGLTTIGNGAFFGCTQLKSIIIPNSVQTVGEYTFQNCTSLASVQLPAKLKKIGTGMFLKCASLENITLPATITEIGDNAFHGCSALPRASLPSNVTRVGVSVFQNCTSLAAVTMQGKVTAIYSYAFYGCESLKTIVIQKGLTTIENNAFQNCNSLETVYFGDVQEVWKHILSKMGSGNDALKDADLICVKPAYQVETMPNKDGIAILNEYMADWSAAYSQFTAAVNNALKAVSDMDDQNSRSAMIEKEAARMREYDKSGTASRGKYLSMLLGDWGGTFEEKYMEDAYHALATFFYDNASASVPDLSSIDLSKPGAANQITESVMKNIPKEGESYPYGNVTYSISSINVFGNRFATMTVTVKDESKYTLAICTTENETKATINAYLKEMKGLAVNSAVNIANAVYKDILGVSLDQLTSNALSAAVTSIEGKFKIVLSERFGKAGVGEDLIDRLNYYYSVYSYAKGAIKAGTAQDITTALNNIKALEYKDKKISDSVANKARSALKQARENLLRAFQEYLDGSIVEKENGFWRTVFGCPVNVSVFSSSGEQIGYVGEEDIWYDDTISITEVDGVKEIISYTEDPLSFKVTATDYGTMSCMFEEYDVSYAPVGRLNYYNIILEPEKTFSVTVQEDLAANAEKLAIISGSEKILADEYISAQDPAGVTISCEPVTEDGIIGGTVTGTGEYIRGDSVILRVQPYEGFGFAGWFDGEYLVCTEDLYEFPARENYTVTARFYKEKPIVIELEVENGGIAVGNGRYDSGETVTLIALPHEGYRFEGWYTEGNLVSLDAKYSFTAHKNMTLCAVFILKNANPAITRISGDDRCRTAIASAEQLKVLKNVSQFQIMVLADARNFPDALAGSYLAAMAEAPLLLFQNAQKTAVMEYINNNLAAGGVLYILGQKDSVPYTVEENLKSGVTAVRLAGDNRYTTCLAILEKADEIRGTSPDAVLVCTGTNFADSLSASATGMPILLVNGSGKNLTSGQKKYLENLSNAEIYVIGGKNTVSEQILNQLHSYDRSGTAERIYGDGREETSVAVAKKFFPAAKAATFAYSRNFPDGLSGGPVAYAMKAPLLLINKGAEGFAADYIAQKQISTGIIFGGTNSVPDAWIQKIFSPDSGSGAEW